MYVNATQDGKVISAKQKLTNAEIILVKMVEHALIITVRGIAKKTRFFKHFMYFIIFLVNRQLKGNRNYYLFQD